jgi:hypothetical protein
MKEAKCAILGSILGPAEISEQPSVPYVTKLGQRTFQRLDDMKTSVAVTLMVRFRETYCRGLSVIGLDPQGRSATKLVYARLLYELRGRDKRTENLMLENPFV